MRQFASQRVFFEPAREFGHQDSGFPDPHKLLLLAIEQALAPPVCHLRQVLQPMRVIVVQPDSSMENYGARESSVTQTLLPPLQTTESFAEAEFRQRIVQGEILSAENGTLYERLGHRIRQIHQLVSGPSGELIELASPVQTERRLLGVSAGPRVVGRRQTTNAFSEHSHTGDTEKESPGPAFIPLSTAPAKTPAPTHRKLFADPGQWRVVRWGEFKEILAQQLAHPERLRDSYRLPCYVQVFETERAVTIDELAAAYRLENEKQTPLYFLTGEIAAKLDLLSLLPPLPVQSNSQERSLRSLLPHDRVFRLLVANDPTVDVAAKSIVDERPTPSTVILKQRIPARFVKEWEFKISREEALYDMNAGSTIGRFLRRFRVFKLRNEFRKWQALLAGRDLDEQLWGVRPPASMLDHPLVKEWLQKTLKCAGYDVQEMPAEWEVFWRRKQG